MSITKNNFDKINILISALENNKIWSDCFSEYLAQGDIVSRKFSFKIDLCVMKSLWVLERKGVSLKKISILVSKQRSHIYTVANVAQLW